MSRPPATILRVQERSVANYAQVGENVGVLALYVHDQPATAPGGEPDMHLPLGAGRRVRSAPMRALA